MMMISILILPMFANYKPMKLIAPFFDDEVIKVNEQRLSVIGTKFVGISFVKL